MTDMKKIMDFLYNLEANNNREWYHEHKKEREEAVQEFEQLVQELICKIGETDSQVLRFEPKELTFKLVRDTRFSKDKSPYNPVFRAHISSQGKLPIPVGFFIYIGTQGNSFLGGGLFADMFAEATAMVRNHIQEHSEEFMDILNEPHFRQHYTIKGTKLKNVPKGYDEESIASEYLKHKSWFLEYPIMETDLFANDFIDKSDQLFKLMIPFNHFLNEALENFTMPKR